MVRTVRVVLFLVAVSAGLALASSGRADNAPACTIATKGDSPVAKACARGGIPAAKTVMKDLAKRARAAGTKFQCDDCHKDDVKYTLTDDARDKFKKLVAAADAK